MKHLRKPSFLDSGMAPCPSVENRISTDHALSFEKRAQVLYAVLSSDYEGHTCPLLDFGYSRDGKRGCSTVAYGVTIDHDDRPLVLQDYPGNANEPLTSVDQVD